MKSAEGNRRREQRRGDVAFSLPAAPVYAAGSRQAVRARIEELKEQAERALAEFEMHERQSEAPSPDDAEIAAAFKSAADQLLASIEETLAEMKAGREKTRALLDDLDRRLTSHG
jgi:glutamyl-tRNA reductase